MTANWFKVSGFSFGRGELKQPQLLDFLISIRSLMTVGRFSVYKCHFREDVAQHSYLTALYAMILADLERRKGRKVDIEKLLRMALLHRRKSQGRVTSITPSNIKTPRLLR